MSDGQRIPLAEAERLAGELRARLAPACERIEVAGSVRRRKADVGDIEFVVIPRMESVEVGVDLFGHTELRPMNRFEWLCERLLDECVLRKRINKLERPSWGPDLKWATYWPSGVNVDLYTASVATWAVTLLIRTGDSRYSNCLATPKSRYTHDGYRGLLPDHIQLRGWRYVHRGTGEPYETPTEESVFALLGMDWVPPAERTPSGKPWEVRP